VLGHPFIGSKGEQGGQTGRGIRQPVVGHHYGHPVRWGEETDGVSAVWRGGSAAPFPGDEGHRGGMRTLEAAAAVFGWLHPEEEGSQAGPTRQ
jgi:hypothetical protein